MARFAANTGCTPNVVVQPSRLGTECLQVVDHAAALFEDGDPLRGIRKRAFEKVYAVFDRDDHKTFHNAVARARSLNGKLKNDLNRHIQFVAIPSRPSFEFWLLRHFDDVRHLMHRDEVMQRLRKHFSGYEKGMAGTFAHTRSHLAVATQRAQKLLADDVADDREPYTGVVELTTVLTHLRSTPNV